MRSRQLRLDAPNNKLLFISMSFPFICRNIPFVKPSVCRNYPLVIRDRKIIGFTLVELIVTLTIAGILIALATPAMRSFIQDQRLTSQANEFIADLNIARSEAIKRGANVVVCKQGGTDASPSCGSGAGWANGWVVFVDTDGDGVLDSGETIVRTKQTLEGSNSLNSIGTTTTSFSFANTGLTSLSSGTEIAMRLCDSRGSTKGVTVYVSSTGRTRIDRSVISCT